MRMHEWQADKAVSDKFLRYIGALRTYAARMNFFLSVPNTLMIAALFYTDSAALQSVFPTVYHWVGFILFAIVPAAITLDRVILHPAQIMYNLHQNGQENRSPNYRETMRNQRKIDEIAESLEGDQ